ncbi:CAP-associated domain-containing protein [Aneurinibacillus tyrosinisolvens]|uniref:CAP domain-containing protein n=1 Tax=Aneurinibacillus tyrosinisolvens TaxID=1443435 RepID=UPI000A5A5017|nr:CAP-associated domain-containing protein [Aneurinibacillus tyrosinisolvens]
MRLARKVTISLAALTAAFTFGVWTGSPIAGTQDTSENVTNVATVTSSSFKANLGDKWETVKARAGMPKRFDTGIKETKWWIYDNDWIGYRNGKVVELFTSYPSMQYNGIKIGMTRGEVQKKLAYTSRPQWSVFNAMFSFQNTGTEKVLYKAGSQALIAYYDTLDGNKLLGLRVVNPEELVYKKYFGYTYQYVKRPTIPVFTTDAAAVNKQGAEEILLLSNVERMKKKVPGLTWSSQAALSSYKHSKDMSVHKYFSHTLFDGRSPFDLMAAEKIKYSVAAENIAMGYTDSIEAVFGWMNSTGHRKSLLNPSFKKLGAGVYSTYYTQHFYTP